MPLHEIIDYTETEPFKKEKPNKKNYHKACRNTRLIATKNYFFICMFVTVNCNMQMGASC